MINPWLMTTIVMALIVLFLRWAAKYMKTEEDIKYLSNIESVSRFLMAVSFIWFLFFELAKIFN